MPLEKVLPVLGRLQRRGTQARRLACGNVSQSLRALGGNSFQMVNTGPSLYIFSYTETASLFFCPLCRIQIPRSRLTGYGNRQLREGKRGVSRMRLLHTSAGDHWRDMLRRPDGTVPDRIRSLQVEQAFWNQQMASGLQNRTATPLRSGRRCVSLPLPALFSSVLEIGPAGEIIRSYWAAPSLAWAVWIFPLIILRFSRKKARQESISLVTFCSAWETAETGRWDLVLATTACTE